jgi:ribosomal protein L11 methyltransferase
VPTPRHAPASVTAPLLRVVVPVAPGDEEQARAALLELAPDGFEEVDGGRGFELVAYCDADAAARIHAVFANVRSTTVAAGWEDAWRTFHSPVVAAGVWIGPPWEPPPRGAPAVVIDPGRAFGTGAHATTRLVVELMDRLDRGSLLDVGCGSGVLAICAARMGFAPVTAVDVDPVAVEVTVANASLNGVALDAFVADALCDPLPTADVAVANVLLEPVERILARLAGRAVVTSGYLAGQVPAHPGWEREGSLELDGWAADLFRRVTV